MATDILTRLADAWPSSSLTDSTTTYMPNPYDMLGGGSVAAGTLPASGGSYSAGELRLSLRITITTAFTFSGTAANVTFGVAYADALNGSNLMVAGTGNVFLGVRIVLPKAALVANSVWYIPVPPMLHSMTDGSPVLGKRYVGGSVFLDGTKGTNTGAMTVDLVRDYGDLRRYYPAVT